MQPDPIPPIAPIRPIDAIFLEAAELPDDEARLKFLDEACGNDHDLKARVQRLLAAVPRIGSFMEAAAFQPSTPLAEESLPMMDLTGQTIGPYKLLQKLGEGGMGVVYMADQDHPVRRRVAIKVVRAGMDSSHIAARFEQERVALAMMDHPNIARVLDAGTTSDGRPYFAMELVKGIPITEYCDQYHLSLRERLELLIPVCRAVQHAHQKGIIHRDLKPSNVIVGLYDARPIPKVIDFGVAKAVGQRLIDRTMFTEIGQIVGTLEYMAPEQAELNNLDVDTRADIYSLGALLYELLTGSTPFTAQQLRSVGISEMLRVIKDSDPAKPSTRISTVADLPKVASNRQLDPTRLASAIRGELDWITLKCLEKDRGRRYESAIGLADDLERYLADEPVLACPPSASYRFRKIVRRNRPVIAAASAFAVLLVGGIVAQSIALVAVNRERKAKVVALEAEAKRRKQTQEALDAMSSQVIEDWLTKQPVLLPEHKQFLEMALGFYEDFATDSGQDEESRAAVAIAQQRVGTIRGRLGQHADAQAASRRSRDIFAQLVRDFPNQPKYRLELAKANLKLGYLMGLSGQFQEAEPEVRQGLEIYGHLTTDFPDETDYRRGQGETLTRLGVILKNLGRLRESRDAYEQALEIRRKLSDKFPNEPIYQEDLGSTYLNLGNVLDDLALSVESLESHRKAVAIYEKLAAEASSVWRYRDQLAICLSNLGIVLNQDEKTEPDAEAAFRQSLAIRTQLAAEFPTVPEHRRGLAIALNNLGIVLKDTERWQEAEEAYRKTLAIHQQLAADYPTVVTHQNEVAGAMANLARILLLRNDPQGARELLEQALPHHQAALRTTPNHPAYRFYYRINRWRLTEAMLALKEHAAAADMAEQFLQAAVELPRDAYTAAGLLAECARLAENDDRLDAGERESHMTTYQDLAIAALRQAVDTGFTDVAQLKSDTTLDPLRSHEGFQALLRELDRQPLPPVISRMQQR